MAACGVSPASEAIISSSAENRLMPVLRGSPRAGFPPVYFGASSSALKSIRPQEAQLWIVFASRTC